MALNQVQVGNIPSGSLLDGATPTQLAGRAGEAIEVELHGKYYTQNYRSNFYMAGTAVGGLAFSIFSNTTFVGLILWNTSSSKNLVPVRTTISMPLVATTTSNTQFGYIFGNSAGAGPVSGGIMSAITTNTPIRYNMSTLVGGAGVQGSSVATVGLGATFTTAPTWGRNAALTWYNQSGNTAISNVGAFEDFEGALIIPPGAFMALCTSVASGGGNVAANMTWYESAL